MSDEQKLKDFFEHHIDVRAILFLIILSGVISLFGGAVNLVFMSAGLYEYLYPNATSESVRTIAFVSAGMIFAGVLLWYFQHLMKDTYKKQNKMIIIDFGGEHGEYLYLLRNHRVIYYCKGRVPLSKFRIASWFVKTTLLDTGKLIGGLPTIRLDGKNLFNFEGKFVRKFAPEQFARLLDNVWDYGPLLSDSEFHFFDELKDPLMAVDVSVYDSPDELGDALLANTADVLKVIHSSPLWKVTELRLVQLHNDNIPRNVHAYDCT